MLDWVLSWMNPLPLWLQFIIGIGGLALTVFLLVFAMPKMIDFFDKKVKEL